MGLGRVGLGAGGAGRSRTGGLRTWGDRVLGAQTVGAEGAGPRDRRCGAETGVVSGRAPHPRSFVSLLSEPSPLRLPNPSGGGSNLRQGCAEGGDRGWLGLAGPVPASSPAHVAPPRSPARPRLCVGEQVPATPRPCIRAPHSHAGRQRHRRADFVRPFGAGPAEQPGLRLPGRPGNEDPARIARVGGGLGEGSWVPEPAVPGPPRGHLLRRQVALWPPQEGSGSVSSIHD